MRVVRWRISKNLTTDNLSRLEWEIAAKVLKLPDRASEASEADLTCLEHREHTRQRPRSESARDFDLQMVDQEYLGTVID